MKYLFLYIDASTYTMFNYFNVTGMPEQIAFESNLTQQELFQHLFSLNHLKIFSKNLSKVFGIVVNNGHQ